MSSDWGRDEQYSWPSDKPLGTITAVLVAAAVICAGTWLRYELWTPLERYWFPQYLWSSWSQGQGRYRLLAIIQPGQKDRLPLEQDVEAGETRLAGKRLPFQLTQAAAEAGESLVLEAKTTWDNQRLKELLQHWIYQDASPKDLLNDLAGAPLWASGVLLLLGLIVAIPVDRERARLRKYGRRVRGPELVTTEDFNRQNRSDGIGFRNTVRRTLAARWLGWMLRRDASLLRIPRQRECSHVLIMGDTDTGKSALMRQILLQIVQRGETAIVYDPALEYTPQFYNPERGDVILNVLDKRMPYWLLADEVEHEAEAATVAASLFPERPGEQRFFIRGPKEIFAHLLTCKPTTEDLARWMSNDEEIDSRVKGTEVASLIAASAPAQREGILSELKMVGKVLKLLPRKEETTAVWSTRQWTQERRGWLFLTSTPVTRERLAPLISLWLDMLVLRLMHDGLTNPNPRPVWFVLDELASLQKLPQLHAAVTENRKSNCPVVLGFQGRSQLEARYGLEAEAMFSQPATKIFLRTSEPKSAKWISEAIGEIEIEALRETRSQGHYPQHRDTRSFQLERRVEPLVMASEICGLPSLRGYLKSGNHVVRLSFPYINLPKRQPAIVPLAKEQTAVTGPTPKPEQPPKQGPPFLK